MLFLFSSAHVVYQVFASNPSEIFDNTLNGKLHPYHKRLSFASPTICPTQNDVKNVARERC